MTPDTQIQLESNAPHDFHCSIQRATISSLIESFMGQTDVTIGDKRFDRSFVIYSNEPQLVRLWLSPIIKRQMIERVFRGLSINGPSMSLIATHEQSHSMRVLVDHLQNRSEQLYQSWAQIAAALQGEVSSTNPRRWDFLHTQIQGSFLGNPIHISLQRQRDLVVSCIEWRRPGANETFSITRPHNGDERYTLHGISESRSAGVLQLLNSDKFFFERDVSSIEITPQHATIRLAEIDLQLPLIQDALRTLSTLSPIPTQGAYR